VTTISWFDIILLVIFLLHIINGLSRGLVKQLFDVFGFLIIIGLSFWGSRLFSDSLAGYINPEDIIPHHDVMQQLGVDLALEKAPQLVAGVIAFLAIFLILSIAFRLFSSGFRWVNRVPVIGFLNRIGGAVLGAAIGTLFVYIIIAAVSLIPLPLFAEALDNSEVVFVTDHYLTPAAEEIKSLVINYYLSLND
jgi:uncharacterized membrane protein required for colicin V production